MGTSIWSAAERFEDGRWQLVGEAKRTHGGSWLELPEAIDRYARPLFEILAGVWHRGGEDPEIVPISPPKGPPSDASPEVQAWLSQRDDGDRFAVSYLTVAEIDAYDWQQSAAYTDELNASAYAAWTASGRGRARSHHGFVGKPVRVSNEQMDALLAAGTSDQLSSAVTTVTWRETYAESVAEFWTEAMPRLRALGRPEHVRIVFYFT